MRGDLHELTARQRATEDVCACLTDQLAGQRASKFSELQQIAVAADSQFDSLFERVESIESRDRNTRMAVNRLDGEREALHSELAELRRQQRDSGGAESFTSMIDRFNQSMDDAMATNRQLREALGKVRRAAGHSRGTRDAAASEWAVSGASGPGPRQADERAGSRPDGHVRTVQQSRDPAPAGPALRSALGHALCGSGSTPTVRASALRTAGTPATATRSVPARPHAAADPTGRQPTAPGDSPRDASGEVRQDAAARDARDAPAARSKAGRTRHAVTSAAVGAALLVTGLFGGQQLDARTVNEAASTLDPLELQVELAGHAGRFAWPVSYGVPDPTGPGFQHARGGINIPAELGDPVVAVEDGRVIHSAQSVRGMGHLIVVEHADGLQSV